MLQILLKPSEEQLRENICTIYTSFPGGSDGKESTYDVGDLGLIPGLGRSHGEGNGNPLQYSCLENPMDRGAWQATAHRAARIRHNLAAERPPGTLK